MGLSIGVTGSRNGPTPAQWAAVTSLLADLTERDDASSLHHGSCLGFDEMVHRWARADDHRWVIYCHPGDLERWRAKLDGDSNYAPMPNRLRNVGIVNAADVLVAAPAGSEQSSPRSGTWQTVRNARLLGKRTIVVDQLGRISDSEAS